MQPESVAVFDELEPLKPSVSLSARSTSWSFGGRPVPTSPSSTEDACTVERCCPTVVSKVTTSSVVSTIGTTGTGPVCPSTTAHSASNDSPHGSTTVRSTSMPTRFPSG